MRLAPWLLAAAVAAAAVAAISTSPSLPPPVGRGSPAPDFRLERVGGGGPLALSELRGQVVLLNFWATWCKPCEDEMPAMERLYRGLAGRDFEMVAVSVDEEPGVVVEFQRRLGLSFPIVMDPEQRVSRDFQSFRFPETFLIDRQGTVIDRFVGPKDWDAEPYVARNRRLLEADSGTPRS